MTLDRVSQKLNPGQSLTLALPWASSLPASWVGILAPWCPSRRLKQILKGLPGQFPFKLFPVPSPGLVLRLRAEPTPMPSPPRTHEGKKVQWPW